MARSKPSFEAIIATVKKVHLSYVSEDAFVAEVESSDGERQYRALGVIDDQGEIHMTCDLACGWWVNKKTWCKHLFAALARYSKEREKL